MFLFGAFGSGYDATTRWTGDALVLVSLSYYYFLFYGSRSLLELSVILWPRQARYHYYDVRRTVVLKRKRRVWLASIGRTASCGFLCLLQCYYHAAYSMVFRANYF